MNVRLVITQQNIARMCLIWRIRFHCFDFYVCFSVYVLTFAYDSEFISGILMWNHGITGNGGKSPYIWIQPGHWVAAATVVYSVYTRISGVCDTFQFLTSFFFRFISRNSGKRDVHCWKHNDLSAPSTIEVQSKYRFSALWSILNTSRPKNILRTKSCGLFLLSVEDLTDLKNFFLLLYLYLKLVEQITLSFSNGFWWKKSPPNFKKSKSTRESEAETDWISSKYAVLLSLSPNRTEKCSSNVHSGWRCVFMLESTLRYSEQPLILIENSWPLCKVFAKFAEFKIKCSAKDCDCFNIICQRLRCMH